VNQVSVSSNLKPDLLFPVLNSKYQTTTEVAVSHGRDKGSLHLKQSLLTSPQSPPMQIDESSNEKKQMLSNQKHSSSSRLRITPRITQYAATKEARKAHQKGNYSKEFVRRDSRKLIVKH